jgi:hypothetical protein
VEDSDAALVVHAARHREGSPASLVVTARRLVPRWRGRHPITRLGGLRSEVAIARSRLHPFSLSPLGRGQGEGAKGEGAKGEGAKGEGAKGEGAKGEGAKGEGAKGEGAGGEGAGGEGQTWALDWTL